IQETIDVSSVSAPDIVPLKDKTGGAGPSQIVTRYTYDPLFSKMTSKADAEGHTTYFVYDSPVPVPNLPAGINVQFSGLPTGNLLATIDALGNATTYDYAGSGDLAGGHFGLGDLKAITDPRGNTTHFTDYDRYGNLLRSVDATGHNVTTQRFDVRSQLLS